MRKFFRYSLLLILLSSLTGCFYWLRAYETYLQMGEFDQNFSITADDAFIVHFKDPVLYSDDFISLSKLQPSLISGEENQQNWRYWFIKVDEQGALIKPEIKFHFDLAFNDEQKLARWIFSPLFLQIAPAEFLEASLRSLGGAKINKLKRQLKADTDSIEKISADLPQKSMVIKQLGEPLKIEHLENEDVYYYHFQLQTDDIEHGYEDRALSIVKLSFDKQNNELTKMAGRFIGLKLSIKYRKYLKEDT